MQKREKDLSKKTKNYNSKWQKVTKELEKKADIVVLLDLDDWESKSKRKTALFSLDEGESIAQAAFSWQSWQ